MVVHGRKEWAMSFEPVKLGMQASTPSDPNAIPLPLAADSSYWSLSPEQQRRMLQDLSLIHI